MKEFSLNLDKYLSNGLRSSDQDSINSPYLTTLKSARVKDNGLRPLFTPKALVSYQPNLIASFSGAGISDTWTLTTGVTISTTTIVFSSATNGRTATCTLSAAKGLDQGETYSVAVTASAFSAGAITMTLGGTAGSVPLNSATKVTQDIVCGSGNFDFVLTAVGTTTATISSVIVTRAGSTISQDIYPYPLVFVGGSDTISVHESRLYTDNSGVDTNLNSVNGMNMATQMDQTHVYNAHSISSIASFEYQVTAPPDFVDLKRAWYLFSNQGVMFKTNWASINDDREGKALFSATPKINTGAYHKGRIIVGGFDPANVWSADWLALWDRWKEMLPDNVVLTEEGFDYNYVLWSGIGEGLLWLIYPQIAAFGLMNDRKKYSVDYPYFFELIRRNDIGWLPLPARSHIRKIRALEDHVIVYADDGIFALTPMLEPAPGYRLKTIADFGVHQSFGIGVGDAEHLFVDVSGRMWKIDKELNLDFLDYNEFIGSTSNMIDSAQDFNAITYNHIEKEYYIGDKDKSYVLTDTGLSENLYTIVSSHTPGTSAINSKTFFKALYVDHSTSAIFELETEIFDIGMRSIKQLTSVNLGVTTDSSTTLYVRIGARYSSGGSFNYSAWKTVNNEGFVYMLVSGVDFKLGIKTGTTNEWEALKLSSVSVGWQLSDKRNVRGEYAS